MPELQLGVGERGVERNRFREQRFDLVEIEAGILGALSLPQAHRVVVEGAPVARLELGETAEPLDDFVGLAGRTVVGAGQGTDSMRGSEGLRSAACSRELTASSYLPSE